MPHPSDTSPAHPEAAAPRLGRRLALSGLRVLAGVALVLAVVAGSYAVHTHRAEKAQERAQQRARIREVRDAVVALAAGHTVYAPSEWDVRAYPSLGDGRIVSWGTSGGSARSPTTG